MSIVRWTVLLLIAASGAAIATEPATKSTRVGLTVSLRADEDANGAFDVRIVGATTGAMVMDIVPPSRAPC
jgi:hypothetical protein